MGNSNSKFISLIEPLNEDDVTLNTILLRLSSATRDFVSLQVDEEEAAAIRIRRQLTLAELDIKKLKEKVLKVKQNIIDSRKLNKLIKKKKNYGKKISQRRDINHYVKGRNFQRLLPPK